MLDKTISKDMQNLQLKFESKDMAKEDSNTGSGSQSAIYG